jgi:hypothetical protein
LYATILGVRAPWSVRDVELRPAAQEVEVFLVRLLSLGRARTTLRLHRDNLSTLGGQIIRLLHEKPSLRKQGIVRVLAEAIDDDGGPIITHRSII